MIYIKLRNPIELSPYGLAKMMLFWRDKDSESVSKLGDILARGIKGSREHNKALGSIATNKPIDLDDLIKVMDIGGEYETKLWKGMQWFNERFRYFEYIKVSGYDVWNADETLCSLIYPVLVKYKEENNGIPNVYDKDIPEELLESSAEDKWEWVVDEMIYALNPDVYTKAMDEDDSEALRIIENGRLLFSKYMSALWT